MLPAVLYFFFRCQIFCIFTEDTDRALRELQTCSCVLSKDQIKPRPAHR